MKKLIPALCMLLVAACLMGTSTYAWFSANKQVSAEGMEVKAASDGGLAIAPYNTNALKEVVDPAESDFKSEASFSKDTNWYVGNAAISPASWNGTTWFAATAKNADNGSANTMETLGTDESYAAYMLHTKWAMKSLKDGVTVPVTVTGVTVTGVNKSATLDKALRVAIKGEDGWFIFAPVYKSADFPTGSPDLKYVASYTTKVVDEKTVVDTVTTATTNTLPYSEGYGTTPVIIQDLGTTAKTVDVYVYYEGEDGNCKSANATNIDTLSVTISYMAGAETAVTP